jgi:hypothetical protein
MKNDNIKLVVWTQPSPLREVIGHASVSIHYQLLHITRRFVVNVVSPSIWSHYYSQSKQYINKYIILQGSGEWVIDCCLTSNEQFSAIPWREQVTFRRDEEEFEDIKEVMGIRTSKKNRRYQRDNRNPYIEEEQKISKR